MQPEGTGGFREEGTSNRSLGQRRVCDDPGRGQGETLQGAQVSSTFRLGYGIEVSSGGRRMGQQWGGEVTSLAQGPAASRWAAGMLPRGRSASRC